LLHRQQRHPRIRQATDSDSDCCGFVWQSPDVCPKVCISCSFNWTSSAAAATVAAAVFFSYFTVKDLWIMSAADTRIIVCR